MGWSMDRQGLRTLFDHESKRLKQYELSGSRRERVSLDTYPDELAARDAEFLKKRGTVPGRSHAQMSCTNAARDYWMTSPSTQ
jgi:hypothetical protein